MAKSDLGNKLLSFIDASPTPAHTQLQAEKILVENGFQKLSNNQIWDLKNGGKYFFSEGSGSLTSLIVPQNRTENSATLIYGAHTDSPGLRLRPIPDHSSAGFHCLSCDTYGGGIWNSWIDRDLGLAGKIFYTTKSDLQIHSQIVEFPNVFRIPQLAIHLNREVNKTGLQINTQNDLLPILGIDSNSDFKTILKEYIPKSASILSWDLSFFDKQKATYAGLQNEFIFAPRLDDLAMVFSGIDMMTSCIPNSDSWVITELFNHEEIGSETPLGARASSFHQLLKQLQIDTSKALILSADMAHALHPSASEKYDENHKTYLNKGPVLKTNSSYKYASDAVGSAIFRHACQQAEVPMQEYVARNDIPCGSTIGPAISTQTGITTIDFGSAMLSMHSSREMAGSEDPIFIQKLLHYFAQNFGTKQIPTPSELIS